ELPPLVVSLTRIAVNSDSSEPLLISCFEVAIDAASIRAAHLDRDIPDAVLRNETPYQGKAVSVLLVDVVVPFSNREDRVRRRDAVELVRDSVGERLRPRRLERNHRGRW